MADSPSAPSPFARELQQLRHENAAGAWGFRQALIDVSDTASVCKLWFESHDVTATAADIVAMTALVMAREAALQAATLMCRDWAIPQTAPERLSGNPRREEVDLNG